MFEAAGLSAAIAGGEDAGDAVHAARGNNRLGQEEASDGGRPGVDNLPESSRDDEPLLLGRSSAMQEAKGLVLVLLTALCMRPAAGRRAGRRPRQPSHGSQRVI